MLKISEIKQNILDSFAQLEGTLHIHLSDLRIFGLFQVELFLHLLLNK